MEKDKKMDEHLEQAAIGGHPNARHNLGVVERENGRMEGAVKHWITIIHWMCKSRVIERDLSAKKALPKPFAHTRSLWIL